MANDNFFTDLETVRLAYYEKHYYEDKKSWKEIAELLGTYPNRVRRDATKLGIESRTKSDAQKIALSEGKAEHPTAGKKQSEETKMKSVRAKVRFGIIFQKKKENTGLKLAQNLGIKKPMREKDEFFKRSSQAIQEASRKWI